MSGLGFHSAHIRGEVGHSGFTASDEGTERMRKFYTRMGQPGAAKLVENAPANALFRPNGQTTLAYKIATSLSAPTTEQPSGTPERESMCA